MEVITTVITPASSYDLTTVEYVLDDLGIDEAVNSTLIRRWITAASRSVMRYCDRVFAVETVKDEFFGYSYQRTLQLTRSPIKAATTPVVIEGSVTLASSDFRINYDTGELVRVSSTGVATWWCGVTMAVTYDAGYATVPEDLQDAVVRLVRARWMDRGRDPALRGESIPNVADYQYWVPNPGEAADIPSEIADVLNRYRRMVA